MASSASRLIVTPVELEALDAEFSAEELDALDSGGVIEI